MSQFQVNRKPPFAALNGFSGTIVHTKLSGSRDYRTNKSRVWLPLICTPEHPETNCQLKWRKFNFLCHWKQDMRPASSISVLSPWITTMTLVFKRILYVKVGASRADHSRNLKRRVVKVVCFWTSCFGVMYSRFVGVRGRDMFCEERK